MTTGAANGRSVPLKPDPLRRARDALNTWIHWRDRIDALGYPPGSWEGRAIDRGGSAPAPGKDRIPRMVPREALLVDRFLHIGGTVRDRRVPGVCLLVLRAKALLPGDDYERARKAGLKLRTFERVYREALGWLAGYLDEWG